MILPVHEYCARSAAIILVIPNLLAIPNLRSEGVQERDRTLRVQRHGSGTDQHMAHPSEAVYLRPQ
jgi:hypothetical protein